MRLVGLALAAIAALWYARRRREQPAAVVGAPATPPSVPTSRAVPDAPVEADPSPAPADVAEGSGRTGLDASAGWDDSTNEPTRRGADPLDPTAPGMPGDDVLGVPAWDRPV